MLEHRAYCFKNNSLKGERESLRVIFSVSLSECHVVRGVETGQDMENYLNELAAAMILITRPGRGRLTRIMLPQSGL